MALLILPAANINARIAVAKKRSVLKLTKVEIIMTFRKYSKSINEATRRPRSAPKPFMLGASGPRASSLPLHTKYKGRPVGGLYHCRLEVSGGLPPVIRHLGA